MKVKDLIKTVNAIEIEDGLQEDYDALYAAVDALKVLYLIGVAIADTDENDCTDMETAYFVIKDAVDKWEIRNDTNIKEEAQ